MSVSLNEEVWVRVEQMEGEHAPRPLPLENGFSKEFSYNILGIHSPSETSEAYFILCNDRDEVWFVSNRHFRVQQPERFRRSKSPVRSHHAQSAELI